MLRLKIKFLSTNTKVQKIATFKPHHMFKALTNQTLAHIIKSLLINIDQGELHLISKIGILEKNVKDLGSRTTRQTGDP